MFTTGSKFFFTATVLAAIGALGYALESNNEFLGAVLLGSFAAASLFFGVVTLAFRQVTSAAPATWEAAVFGERREVPRLAVVSPAAWPLIGAAGVALTLVGLVADQVVFIAGLVVLAAAIIEWTVQAWSDRASDDPAYNASVRGRLMHPLEFPILGALAVGVVIFGFSRVMLAVTKVAAVWVFIGVGTLVLAIAILLAARPRISKGVVSALLVVGGVVALAAGTAAAINGERSFEKHHSDESSVGEDGTNEVADKAAVAGSISLTGNTFNVTSLQIPRAIDANLLFTNNDDEEHNLVVRVGEDDEGNPVFVRTAFVEQGNTAFLTVRFDNPGVYEFFSEGGPVQVKGTIEVP